MIIAEIKPLKNRNFSATFKGVLTIIVEDHKKENLEMTFNVCPKKKMFWSNLAVEVITKQNHVT